MINAGAAAQGGEVRHQPVPAGAQRCEGPGRAFGALAGATGSTNYLLLVTCCSWQGEGVATASERLQAATPFLPAAIVAKVSNIRPPQEHEKDDNKRLLASIHSSQAREISLRSRARAIQLALCAPWGREKISRCV